MVSTLIQERQVRPVATGPSPVQRLPASTLTDGNGPAPYHLLHRSDEERWASTRYFDAEGLFIGASGYGIDATCTPLLSGSEADIEQAETIRTRFLLEWDECRRHVLPQWVAVKGVQEASRLQATQAEFIRTVLAHTDAAWWVLQEPLAFDNRGWLRCGCMRVLRPAEYRAMRRAGNCSGCGAGVEERLVA
jgi:hypothetical protein